MSDFMRRLIEISVDRDITNLLELRAGAAVHLGKVEANVRSQTLTNLRRGWASALSGKAFTLYQVLGSAYDFPVFSVGRSEQCLISFRPEQNRFDDLLKDLKNMWKLCNPDKASRVDNYWWRAGRPVEGHREGWMQFQCPRPASLNMEALCHLMGVANVFELAPKAHLLQATLAVEQGATIDISIHLRKT